MCSGHLLRILQSLEHSAHNIKNLDQILCQAITAGLTFTTPTGNCIIRAYSKSTKPIKAILIYNHFIQRTSIRSDKYTYPALLKACLHIFSLPKGKEIHAHVTKIGVDCDMYVQNALVHFYGCMAHITDARLLFDRMPERDVGSWNTLLSIYSASSKSVIEVLVLFKEMVREAIGVDKITLVILLSACSESENKEFGRAIHASVIKMGLGCFLNLENALLRMYAKCREMDAAQRHFLEMAFRRDAVSCTIMINGFAAIGLVDSARDIFNQVIDKDRILWNSMIHAYVKAEHPKEALELFKKMKDELIKPDEFVVVSVLVACASLSDLQYGRLVHRFILQNNIKQDVFLGTALIDMYSKCGSLEEAMVTFYKMDEKDVFTWTTVIEGLSNYGHGNEALSMFYMMEKQGIKPNEATFVSVLMACSRSGLVDEGCLLFSKMVKDYKMQPKIEHFRCLVDLLSRAGLLHQAEEFIKIMPAEESLVAYKTLLSACINYSEFDLGEMVADEMTKLGFHCHATRILLSNFYALAGQWVEVAETRRILKEFDMRKEPGTSVLELKP